MVAALRELFAKGKHPSTEDKESTVQVIAHLLDQAQVIGREHVAQTIEGSPEKRGMAWGGKFTNTVQSAWNIVSRVVASIKTWIDQQNEGLLTPEDIQKQIDLEVELVAGTEIQSAIEQEVLEVLQESGFTRIVWLAQAGACERCANNMDSGPISIGEAFPDGSTTPPAHPRCRCSIGTPGDEDYYKPAWALTRGEQPMVSVQGSCGCEVCRGMAGKTVGNSTGKKPPYHEGCDCSVHPLKEGT